MDLDFDGALFRTAGIAYLLLLWSPVIRFVLAYVAGFSLTAGPLLQEGVPLARALWDAAYTESATIAVMEIVAIAVDLFLAQQARMMDILFWSSLVVSLSMGFIAAFPVNVWLVHLGVKKGMH